MEQFSRGELVFDVIDAGPPTGRWSFSTASPNRTRCGSRSSIVDRAGYGVGARSAATPRRSAETEAGLPQYRAR